MDGTTLGIQKTYLPNHLVQSGTGLLDGSRFEMRNFINRKGMRDLLKDFSKSETSFEEFEELKSEIPSPGLKILFDSLEEGGFTSGCPDSCKRFLAALASDKPVCAIVPPNEEVLDLLTRISDGVNPKDNPATDLKLLHEQVPLLFNILKICGEIPPSIRPVVKELTCKAVSPFEYENGQQRLPHNLPPPQENNASNGYLPCLPELVQRGNYVLDSKKTKQGDCAKLARAKHKKHGTLIPGIFCLLCPHGICYGFEIMRDHESPNIPFTILRTRFPKAPELVIYDNSCRLHEYCLNRDPAFFKNTKFVVDKFHWKNHSGCCEGYNMKLYPTLTVHNSQAAEQCNSAIKPLASMVSYMEYQNFLLFSKLYIWYRNMLRIVKLNPERDVPYKDYFLAINGQS
ncbi:Hypothetical predicted protein [Paramuricea clavata]|uniref:Uncharacterized protein n=1 Tax=Paramuricea clavata TaxID=317549 RepID=A0A7D9L9T8_PARCT|nr:Hypothetical predicted protein [Paramuricea clavata]